jgi:hypothetical protein
MPVKMIQKAAVKQDTLKAVDQTTLTQEERALVDEAVQLGKELEEVKPKAKRFEEIKKILVAVALDRFEPKEKALLKGEIGIVEFSEQSFPREVTDMHGLIGKFKEKVGGYEKLLPYVKITLGDIDKVLSEAEQAPFIGNKPGPRTLKSTRFKGE